VSLAAGADDITSAFIYFLIAVGVMAGTIGALHYLTTTVSVLPCFPASVDPYLCVYALFAFSILWLIIVLAF
jgi:hypothetical protein